MSEPLWTSAEAALATGGKNTKPWSATGVSIDTRTLEKGDLYVALKGDNGDGHTYLERAFAVGAAAALVSRPEGDHPFLQVDDTLPGLEALGRASRARTQAKIAAVTGSAGKTTTKEMLRAMLAEQGSVSASAASYNNHWGVPLSLARMAKSTAYGVFEIGMNHEGEIRALVSHVRPHVAVITTIAPAHLEYFGTVEKIADAKAEIFEGLEKGGSALLPADNPQYARLAAHARDAGVGRILAFGTAPGLYARLVSVESQGEGLEASAEIAGEPLSFTLGVAGAHNALNAVAALAVVKELGADVAKAAAALARFAPLKGRGQRFRAGGMDVIDEAYNANPASMAAALGVLASARPNGRRIAVLGDMLELGVHSTELHRSLIGAVEASHADLVFLCGPHMKALWDALPASKRGAYGENSTALWPQLAAALKPGDAVLVKGSNGSKMSVVIDGLKSLQPAKA